MSLAAAVCVVVYEQADFTRNITFTHVNNLCWYLNTSIICVVYPFRVVGGGGRWSVSKLPYGERVRGGGVTPWTGRQSIKEPTYRHQQPFTLTFTPTVNLEAPINRSCIFLTVRRKTLTQCFLWGITVLHPDITIFFFQIKYFIPVLL